MSYLVEAVQYLQFLVVLDGVVQGSNTAIITTNLQTRNKRNQLLVPTSMIPDEDKPYYY